MLETSLKEHTNFVKDVVKNYAAARGINLDEAEQRIMEIIYLHNPNMEELKKHLDTLTGRRE